MADIRPEDVRIEIMEMWPDPVKYVKVIHLPTGLIARAEGRSVIRAREQALDELAEKVTPL